MKNNLTDLNDHLFAQLERLGVDDLNGDKLKEEVERSKAISSLAKDIVNNAALVLEGKKFVTEGYGGKRELPAMMADKPRLVSDKS
jgi:hypothetical protein